MPPEELPPEELPPDEPPLDPPEEPPLDEPPVLDPPDEPDELLEPPPTWHSPQLLATQNLPVLEPAKLVMSWHTQEPLVLQASPTFLGVEKALQLTMQTQALVSFSVIQ